MTAQSPPMRPSACESEWMCALAYLTSEKLARHASASATLCTTAPRPSTVAELDRCRSDCILLDRRYGVADHVEHELGLREHDDVTRFDLIGRRVHALRHEPLEVGLHRSILGGDDVPARLRLPGDAARVPSEQVGGGRKLGRPDDTLLRRGEIAGKALDAVAGQPEAPAGSLDEPEDVGGRELLQLPLSGLIFVRRERRDVDEPGDAVVRPRRSDHAAAV